MRGARGVTLFEITVAMVIVGLIMAAILVGQDLIASARTRALIKEAEMYKQIIHAFQLKYSALPGDMQDPSKVWPSQTWSAISGATLNDGLIVWSTGEGPRAYRQLELSNLGPVDDLSFASCTTTCDATVGTTVPRSHELNSAGWTVDVNTTIGKNVLILGKQSTTPSGTDVAQDPVLLPREAYQLDMKSDDGVPNGGDVRSRQTSLPNSCWANDAYKLADADNGSVSCSIDTTVGL